MEQIENPEGDPHKYSTDFYSGAESNSVEERQPFPQVMLEQRTFTCRKKKKRDSICLTPYIKMGFLCGSDGKELPTMQET